MNNLLIFRLFVLFPLVGTFVPDVCNAVETSISAIPATHIIVDITLLICLVICSAAIWVKETHQLKTAH
jgi:hypothetical protein